jgi:hypothetical protein
MVTAAKVTRTGAAAKEKDPQRIRSLSQPPQREEASRSKAEPSSKKATSPTSTAWIPLQLRLQGQKAIAAETAEDAVAGPVAEVAVDAIVVVTADAAGAVVDTVATVVAAAVGANSNFISAD